MLRNDKTYYKRNILIAVIISEILVISAFVLSPRESQQNQKMIFSDPVILFDNIPQTLQGSVRETPQPKIPTIKISEDINAFEPLQDVVISEGSSDDKKEFAAKSTGGSGRTISRTAPRLLYEVVPAGGEDDYHGTLQLSLKIGEDGKVIDHRILYNSLDCPDCLNHLIKEAYKSKWEPAAVNGKTEDYWVVKSYSFN